MRWFDVMLVRLLEVRALVHETLAAWMQVREWDGRDEQGHTVATGMYLIRLTAAGKVLTQKLVLTR